MKTGVRIKKKSKAGRKKEEKTENRFKRGSGFYTVTPAT